MHELMRPDVPAQERGLPNSRKPLVAPIWRVDNFQRGSAVRIAYITETFPPEINGVSLTTARTVHFLRRAGHSVQLIRPRQAHEATRSFEDTEHPGDHTFDNGEWRTAGAPIPMYPGLRFGLATSGALREHWQQ